MCLHPLYLPSFPNLPLLPRSGNASVFQYPSKANIIRKINQLEEPPKFNTFPIPPATDFGPLCRSELPDVFFPWRGLCLWAEEPNGWEEENGAVFRSSKATAGRWEGTLPPPLPQMPESDPASSSAAVSPQIRHPFGKQCSLVNHLMK